MSASSSLNRRFHLTLRTVPVKVASRLHRLAMPSTESQTALRALLRDKVHILPNTLARLPTQQSQQMRSPLDLGRRLLKPLESFPAALLRFWAVHPRGHAVIGPERYGYQSGSQPVGRHELDSVAWISAPRLLIEPGLAEPIANLLDHLLGSDGLPDGLWLSDGAGRNAAWSDVARRLQRQAGLGYAPPEVSSSAHSYFAWGLHAYLLDRQSLNTIDPGFERLLTTTLFSAEFWRTAEDEPAT